MPLAPKVPPSRTFSRNHGSGTFAATRGPVVLVVDADDRSREAIKLSLAPAARVYALTSADEVDEVLDFVEPRVIVISTAGAPREAFALARKLRESHGKNRLAIVMVTAPSSTYERVEAIQCGARWCLERPLDQDKLKMAVEQSAQGPRPSVVDAGEKSDKR